MWRVIADKLREEIDDGTLTGQMPPELELRERFGVSRPTVRQALDQLTQEGLIESSGGRPGRRVRREQPLIFHAMTAESATRIAEHSTTLTDVWMHDAAEQGRVGGQSIAVSVEKAGERIARYLGIGRGTWVTVRRRVRTLDGRPHNTATTYYPRDITKGTAVEVPDDIRQGTIAYLAELGFPQDHFRDEVSARMPSPDEARQLDTPRGVPLIVHYRTGFSNGTAIKVTETLWPGDRAVLVYEDGDE
jgi:GntR family transcriptional regulator